MAKKDFKIRKIYDRGASFEVEIEFLDSGDRKKFGYKKNDGWENVIDGKPKFVQNIKDRLAKEKICENNNSSFLSMKNDFEGVTIKEE